VAEHQLDGANINPSQCLQSDRLAVPGYNDRMKIAPGKVVHGRIELDAELPEGASVTVLALEGDETFEADAETEKMLLEAIAQCRRGQTTPLKDVLAEMRSRE
jgi:hypothetical protein